jgi:hypothetical protein
MGNRVMMYAVTATPSKASPCFFSRYEDALAYSGACVDAGGATEIYRIDAGNPRAAKAAFKMGDGHLLAGSSWVATVSPPVAAARTALSTTIGKSSRASQLSSTSDPKRWASGGARLPGA